MSSTRIRVERHIFADPTSTALLLAGPSAVDLWPGVRRIGEVGGRVLVEARLNPAGPPAAEAKSEPSRSEPARSELATSELARSELATSEPARPEPVAPAPTTPVTAASVTARPPRRTPTSFLTSFAWTGPGLPVTDAALTLTYAPGDGLPCTRAELVLDVRELAGSRLDRAELTAMAVGFLANLAGAAESRRAA